MKILRNIFALAISTVFAANSAWALQMNNKVIQRFKKIISECSYDALSLSGVYKSNGYYVNPKVGKIKGCIFENALIDFEYLNEKDREELLNENCNFELLSKKTKIKLAAKISSSEIQQILDYEISKPATPRRIFNEAKVTLENGSALITGTINMKRIPGNPLSLLAIDEFVPFSVRLSVALEGSCIKLSIIEGEINSQEITDDLKATFYNWLNPLWDFSQLDFNCELRKLSISDTINILGMVF